MSFTSAWTLPVAIAAAGLLMLAVIAQFQPPAPLSADAAHDQFSAERALIELRNLLGDESPHPVGRDANRAVRQRLIARLESMGLRPEVQSSVGCSTKFATCAQVQNVLAEIPGTSRDAIALMAHYDSVAPSPGAGDDGAGVAAILEMARVIQAEPEHRNRILLVFTDAEEAGLLGAEAFFAEHPWAADIEAVINLEGAGSGGPVFLLRAAPRSGHLIDAFRDVAHYPLAESMAEEVFKHMPNDTDFSVAMAAGKSGVDFAFSGERNHYHTPLDTIDNLDAATVQHHGENALPLVRALIDQDLRVKQPSLVYTSISADLWFVWPPGTGNVLALAGLGLALLACWRSAARTTSIAIAALAAAGVMLLIVLLEIGLLWAADQLAGVRPEWPANPWPWRGLLYAAPIAAIALIGPWLASRLRSDALLLGSWFTWALLASVMAWFLPLAAYMLIVPLLPAAIACAALSFTRASPASHAWVAVALVLPAAWFLLGLAYGGELTQGLKLAPIIFGPLALLGVALLPAATVDRGRVVTAVATAAIAVSLVAAASVAPYSPHRPQHLSFIHVQEARSDEAAIVAISEDPLPQSVRAGTAFEAGTQPFPWSGPTFTAAPADAATLSAATIEAIHPSTGQRRIRVIAPADAHMIRLWFKQPDFGANAEIAGHTVRVSSTNNDSGFSSLTFHAPPSSGVEFALDALNDETSTAYVAIYRLGLPGTAQPLIEARGDLAVPAFAGDMTVSYQKLSL